MTKRKEIIFAVYGNLFHLFPFQTKACWAFQEAGAQVDDIWPSPGLDYRPVRMEEREKWYLPPQACFNPSLNKTFPKFHCYCALWFPSEICPPQLPLSCMIPPIVLVNQSPHLVNQEVEYSFHILQFKLTLQEAHVPYSLCHTEVFVLPVP